MSRRILLLIAAALAALLVVLFGYRQRQSPEYALREVARGYRAGDLERVERFMDVAAVARTVADDWVAARARDAAGGVPITRATADSLEAEVVAEAARMEAAFRELVRAGAPTPAGDGPLPALLRGARLNRAALHGVELRERTPQRAAAGIRLRYAFLDTTLVLDAVFTGAPGSWRLAGLHGTAELPRRLRNAEARRLLTINRPVDEALAPLLRLEDLIFHADSGPAPLGWVEASVSTWNVGAERIADLQIRLAPRTYPAAGVLLELPAGDTLMPGAVATLRGRLAGEDARGFVPVFQGRDELDVTATRAVLGGGREARRYQAVRSLEP